MIEIIQSETFRRWLTGLRDSRAKALIAARMTRLTSGVVGDAVPVGDGVSELRIHFGPGYRLYLIQRGASLIVLLCGGDKSSQSRDIRNAKRLAKQWRNGHG
jgi:putative addiction module killer protein